MFDYQTLVRRTWLVGHLREGVSPLAETSCLIGRKEVGRVILCVWLLSFNALIN